MKKYLSILCVLALLGVEFLLGQLEKRPEERAG